MQHDMQLTLRTQVSDGGRIPSCGAVVCEAFSFSFVSDAVAPARLEHAAAIPEVRLSYFHSSESMKMISTSGEALNLLSALS